MYVPQFAYSFTYYVVNNIVNLTYNIWFSSVSGNYEYNWYKHLHAGFCVDIYFEVNWQKYLEVW